MADPAVSIPSLFNTATLFPTGFPNMPLTTAMFTNVIPTTAPTPTLPATPASALASSTFSASSLPTPVPAVTFLANPAYPTVPAVGTAEGWILAYMRIHVASDASRRWGYFLWFAIIVSFVIFSFCHATNLRGGVIGAYWSKWSLRRRTIRRKYTRDGKALRPESLPSNSQLLTLAILVSGALLLSFAGPDYLAPNTKAWQFWGRRDLSARQQPPATINADPWQPRYSINKAWWTSGNRTGIIAFALMPLCVILALKVPPFAIFAIPYLVQLHFDKLSYLHRWTARLIWGLTALHVAFWMIQLSTDRRAGTGESALSIAWTYKKFQNGWIAFGFLTLLVGISSNLFRQRYYEIFYASHIILVPATLIAAALHHPPIGAWCWVALGFWLAERTWRLVRWIYINQILGKIKSPSHPETFTKGGQAKPGILDNADIVTSPEQSRQNSLAEEKRHRRPDSVSSDATALVEAAKPSTFISAQDRYIPPPGYTYAELLTGNTIRLTFVPPQPMTWAPGQNFLISIPSVSTLTSHPFTCASISDKSSDNDANHALVFFIRAKKGWTKQLWQAVANLTSQGRRHPEGENPPLTRPIPSRGALFRMWVDGPFGSTVRTKWEDHSTLLIVTGGVGVSFGLSLLLYICMCLAGRDGKHLGGRPGHWGSKNFRPVRVRFVWIVREASHILWCATAIRHCLSLMPEENLQVDICVTNFKKITGKRDGRSSPMPGFMDSMDTLVPPEPNYTKGNRRPGSMESAGADPAYIDLTDFTNSFGDEEPQHEDPHLSQVNYILDLTNFDGDDDTAMAGEEHLNHRVFRAGKARRAKTRRATLAHHARRELEQRTQIPELGAGHGRGRERQNWQGHTGGSASTDFLLSPPLDRRRHSGVDSLTAVEIERYVSDERGTPQMIPVPSRPTTPVPSRPNSPGRSRPTSPPLLASYPPPHHGHARSLSDPTHVDDPMFHGIEQAFGKEGIPGDRGSTHTIIEADRGNLVTLEVADDELRDVSIVSEYVRPGQPKLELIIREEAERTTGSLMVACCGPSSLNAKLRKAIAAQIDPSTMKDGKKQGSIFLIADEFNY